MKSLVALVVVLFYLTGASFAQTATKAIEQAIRDPKRVENAGKADVLQLDKTKISDSHTAVKDSVAIKKRSRSISRKKKS